MKVKYVDFTILALFPSLPTLWHCAVCYEICGMVCVRTVECYNILPLYNSKFEQLYSRYIAGLYPKQQKTEV